MLVFVVDASDDSRIDDARNELHQILADKRMQNIPLLVLANKEDKAVMGP